MQIREEKEDAVLVLTVSDALDSVTAPEFEARLLRHIDAGERALLVDCSGVHYMNSAGLKALLLAMKRLEAGGGRIVLCGLDSNVQMVFGLTGFDRLFVIKADRAEARAAFST